MYVHVFGDCAYAHMCTEAMLFSCKYTRAHIFGPVLHDAVLQRVIVPNVSSVCEDQCCTTPSHLLDLFTCH